MKHLSIILIIVLVIASIAVPATAQNSGEGIKHMNYSDKFYGVVEGMPLTGYAGIWIINKRNVQVGQDTVIKEKQGKVAVGAYVEVKGQQAGKSFIAYTIEVEENGDTGTNPYPGKFYGTVDSIPDTGREGIWIINGREILVTRNTRIEEEYGKAAPGSYVEVKGDYAGKTFTAYEIEVKGERRYRGYTPSPDNTNRSETRDYSPDQEKIYNITFAGTIESMPETGYEGLWNINGRVVEVNRRTLIDETGGRAAIGSYAEVKGLRTADTITAYEIEINAKTN